MLWQRIAQLPLVTSLNLIDSNDWFKIAAGIDKEDRNKIYVKVGLLPQRLFPFEKGPAADHPRKLDRPARQSAALPAKSMDYTSVCWHSARSCVCEL